MLCHSFFGKQVVAGRQSLNTVRETLDKLLLGGGLRLPGDRRHETQHILRAVIDLAQQHSDVFFRTLAVSNVDNDYDGADNVAICVEFRLANDRIVLELSPDVRWMAQLGRIAFASEGLMQEGREPFRVTGRH